MKVNWKLGKYFTTMMKRSLSPYFERKSSTERKSTKPGFFCEILKEIKDLSYLIDNDDVFSEALEHLFCIKKILQPSVPQEKGIPLEPSKMVSKRTNFPLHRCPCVKRRHVLLVGMDKVQ